MKKKTISVLIPAFNEEKHIRSLLTDILAQKGDFILEQIYVVSDRSTDNTVSCVRSLASPLIRLIENQERKGKWYSFTLVQSVAQSDIIISLDADTDLPDDSVFEKVVSSLEKAEIISMRVSAHAPETLFQKILYTGANFSKTVFEKNRPNTDLYLCHGRFIAMTRNCFNSIKWQPTYGDDAFIYLSARQNGFVFDYVDQSEAFFKLPRSLKGYLSQSIRAKRAQKRMRGYFNDLAVACYGGLQSKMLLREMPKFFCRYPVLFSFYIACRLLSDLIEPFYKKNKVTWPTVASTK